MSMIFCPSLVLAHPPLAPPPYAPHIGLLAKLTQTIESMSSNHQKLYQIAYSPVMVKVDGSLVDKGAGSYVFNATLVKVHFFR